MKACQRIAAVSRSSLLKVAEKNGVRLGVVPLRDNFATTSRCSLSPATNLVTSPSSSVTPDLPKESNLPTKETLLRIDWMLEHLVPGLMKSRLRPLFDISQEDLIFEDKLFGYKLTSREALFSHVAKIRVYFRYKSPYNKVEYAGSCVYEGEDVVVLLWRLSYLKSSFWNYLPSFLTQKEPKIVVLEGALDMHVTNDGKVYKIINRKVTAADLEGAKVMSALKKADNERILADEERAWRQDLKERMKSDATH